MPAERDFAAAVLPLFPRAQALAFRILRNRSLAEDACQEAMLRAHRFWGVRRGDAVWPWVRRIVVRECMRLAARTPPTEGCPPDGADPNDPDPEERAIVAEERREVARAVSRLPAGYRAVLQLRYGLEMREAEVAAVLGLPLGTVKWRNARALDHLRGVLTRGASPRLRQTLREAAMRMEIRVGAREIRVTVRPVEPPPVPLEEWSIARIPCTPEALGATFPHLRLPDAVRAAHPGLRPHLLMRLHTGDQTGGAVGAEWCLPEDPGAPVITYHAPDPGARRDARVTFAFPDNRNLELDEQTRVGPYPARWARIDGRHHVWWYDAAGAAHHVESGGTAAEVRRLAEAIAACG